MYLACLLHIIIEGNLNLEEMKKEWQQIEYTL